MYLSLLADYGKETTTEHVVGGIVGGGGGFKNENTYRSICRILCICIVNNSELDGNVLHNLRPFSRSARDVIPTYSEITLLGYISYL